MNKTLAAIGLLVSASMLGGCSQQEPLEKKISAQSPIAFATWSSAASRELTKEEWTDFETMIREIKLKITLDHEASGSEAVDKAMRAKIDGHTVRETLCLGYEARLQRLESEGSDVASIIEENASRVTRPGDLASANALSDFLEQQSAKLARIAGEIDDAKKELKRLSRASGPKTGRPN